MAPVGESIVFGAWTISWGIAYVRLKCGNSWSATVPLDIVAMGFYSLRTDSVPSKYCLVR